MVVENSSGNTAMGLAMMSILEGLRCRMVVRKQTSQHKLDCLRAMGVELVLVDGDLPPEHPESYNQKARRIAAATPGSFFPDQHNNRENSEAHYLTTGPEIWQQMEGRIDYLVAGIGTGGTICGIARYLKEQDPAIRVVAVDPEGSVFYDHFHTGRHGRPGRYLLEGLGDEEIIGCPDFDAHRRHVPGHRPRGLPRHPRARPHRGDPRRRLVRRRPVGRPQARRRRSTPRPGSSPSSPTPAPATSHHLLRRLDAGARVSVASTLTQPLKV